MKKSEMTRYMAEALRVAREGMVRGYLPIGAVVVGEGRVLSEGFNTVTLGESLMGHAELNALKKLDEIGHLTHRKEMALFTTLEPCMMCLGAAATFHLGTLCFGLSASDDGFTRVALDWNRRRPHNYRKYYDLPNMTGGILEDECRELIAEFSRVYPEDERRRWLQSLIDGAGRQATT